MRACFLGQNVTKLGYGVAILHTPRLPDPDLPQDEKPVLPAIHAAKAPPDTKTSPHQTPDPA